MVLLNKGKEIIAQAISEKIVKAQSGEGTTAPLPTDTTLEAPISSSLKSTVNTVSNNICTFDYILLVTDANGYNISELGLSTDTPELASRYVLTPLAKSDNLEIKFKIQYLVR